MNSGLAIFNDYSESIVLKNFIRVSEIESGLSVSKSLESGLQIYEAKKQDPAMVVKLIARLIDLTSVFFNVNKNIDEYQLFMIANEVADNFQYENIEDLILCFKYARAGRYGSFSQLYGRIDGEVIFNWLNQYMMLKAEEREKQLHNQKFENMIHPDVAKIIGKAIEDYDAKKKQEEVKAKKPAMSMEKWIEFFEENFDEFTDDQLLEIKKMLVFNNLYGSYNDHIKIIEKRLIENGVELKEILK